MHELLESYTEEFDECEEDDERHCQEKFLHLRKTQEQLGDCTSEIEDRMRK